MRRPFHAMAKPAGAACNLDCAYCFYLSKALLHERRDMDDRTLVDHLEHYLDAQPDGDVVVAWQGGEPTLRGIAFFARAIRYAEQLRRPGQRVRHTLQTNATLLDDGWAAFLAEHDVLVGVSIDGPADLHDRLRTNRAGRGTHAQAVRGWRALERHGVARNVLCAVTSVNAVEPLRVWRHLVDDLGAEHVQLVPVVERVGAADLPRAERGWDPAGGLLYRQVGDAVTSRTVTAEQWGSFLVAVFDAWWEHDRDRVRIGHVDAVVGARAGIPTMCVHAPTCGDQLAVEQDGTVYACDHFVEPAYRRGNIRTQTWVEIVEHPDQRAFGAAKRDTLSARCRACPVLWACHGGCPKDRFVTNSDGSRQNWLCDGYARFFAHAAERLWPARSPSGEDATPPPDASH